MDKYIFLNLPQEYVIIDIETTGLSVSSDEIIELAGIKIKDGEIIKEFSSLVKPNKKIKDKITEITHITNEMVINSPKISEILPEFLSFLGDDLILAHNSNFDLSFIFKYAKFCNLEFKPYYIDTLELAKKFSGLYECSLLSLAKHYNISQTQEHRAINDCKILFNCLKILNISPVEYKPNFDIDKVRVKVKDVLVNNSEIIADSKLSGKYCVISGDFSKYNRTEAYQEIVKRGGIPQDTITKQTNYLFCGENYGKTKLNKAKEYMEKGLSIKILQESDFYNLLGEN